MSKPFRLPIAEALKIKELYDSGNTITQIVATGYSRGTVRRALQRTGAVIRPGRARVLSQEESARILVEYEAGLSITSLVRKYGRDYETIRQAVTSSGGKIRETWSRGRGKLSTEYDPKPFVDLYYTGASLMAISAEFSVSPSSVRKILTRAGVRLRKPGPVTADGSHRRTEILRIVRNFKVSTEHATSLYTESVSGTCMACGASKDSPRNSNCRRLCIDHDHRTGHVRGILCHKCNLVVGLLDDDRDMASAVVKYLTEKCIGGVE